MYTKKSWTEDDGGYRGKCFVATSWKVLMQHTEVTASRLPPCVVVSFEPMPNSPSLPLQVHQACQRKMLLVRGSQPQGQGHWPIPEAYWPDPTHQGIPPRHPHPMIAYKPVDADPYIPPNFIFDKYEIESNPIMGFLLKANAGICWQVFVRSSKCTNHGYGDPFGYLRLNRVGSNLTLFVLPYNYPILWQLLEQLGKIPGGAKMSPSPQWRQDMERYCNNIPAYYGPPLRIALKRWGLNAHVIPESMELSILAGFVGTQLKRLKTQAKELFDADMSHIMTEQQILGASERTCYSGRTLPQLTPSNGEAPPGFTSTTNLTTHPCVVGFGEQVSGRKLGWEVHLPSGPTSFLAPLPCILPALNMPGPETMPSSVPTGILKDINLFKNPFDIQRDQLLSQLEYLPIRVAVTLDSRKSRRIERESGKPTLRASLTNLAALIAAKEENDARHTLPIEKMGDFNDALLKQQPPRNPFAEEPDRSKQQRVMFGNPYRQEKSDGGADEGWSEGTGGLLQRGRKRRRRIQQQGESHSSPSLSTSSSCSSLSNLADSSAEVASPNMEVMSPQRMQQRLDSLNTSSFVGKASELVSVAFEKDIDEKRIFLELDSAEYKSILSQANHNAVISTTMEKLIYHGAKTGVIEVDFGHDTVLANDFEIGGLDQGRKRRIVAVTPLGPHYHRSNAVTFLLSVIRALRNSKPFNLTHLFELLSVADFPGDKGNFLEHLILQARHYNKSALEMKLVDYRDKEVILQPDIIDLRV